MAERRTSPYAILAAVLAVAITAAGVRLGSNIAAGADSYGYVSQADLLRRGALEIPQPGAHLFPWPQGEWTLTPLGYRPSQTGSGIVPTYAPGLPMLIAGATAIGGHCALGWVVPLCAGLLVAATFGIGRRVDSDATGLIAAWLVATSPVVLMMSMSPMSDVPAGAFWALATFFCLRESRASAFAAGLAAAVAIAIRPNLVPLAALMAAWLIWNGVGRRPARAWVADVAPFALPIAAVSIGIAALNVHLYGATTNSGYGRLRDNFDLSNLAGNIRRYGWWFITSHSPLGFVGLAALVVPARLFGGSQPVRARGLVALMVAGVLACYLAYLQFTEWWYLRFLIPAWPALFVATGWALRRIPGVRPSWVAVVVLAAGLYGLWFAKTHHAFSIGQSEYRYVAVAKIVQSVTEDDSVIITIQHSGSVRYYGGRTTLRFDFIDPDWLDRAIEWFRSRGQHPYILLEDWEREKFIDTFGHVSDIGRLQVVQMLRYEAATPVSLYDPLLPGDGKPSNTVAPAQVGYERCTHPGRVPVFLRQPSRPAGATRPRSP